MGEKKQIPVTKCVIPVIKCHSCYLVQFQSTVIYLNYMMLIYYKKNIEFDCVIIKKEIVIQ